MQITLKEADFWTPPLATVAEAVAAGLRENYRTAEVSVEACPDLRALGCAFAGLGGAPFLIEIGGEPYAHNPALRDDASFDLGAIGAACGARVRRSSGRASPRCKPLAASAAS